jgi:hypothetical protein
VALVLLVDGSSSIDAAESRLQWTGYRSAFRDPRLADAIAAGPNGRIAVAIVEFGGPREQRVAVGWRLIADAADARALAAAIAERPPQAPMLGGTALGAALRRAGALLRACPCDPARRVVDVSGDGENNRGPQPAAIRAALVDAGVTINGLPLSGLSDSPDLAGYFDGNVVGGDGAFAIAVEHASAFPSALLRKLLLEIAGTAAVPTMLAGAAQTPGPHPGRPAAPALR